MRLLLIVATIAIATLVGCATQPVEPPRATMPEARPCCRSAEPAPSRSAIVRTAATLVGAKTISSKGRHIEYDCAGVTRAIFLEHGIDLYDGGASDPQANGVKIIYAHVRHHGRFRR